MKYVPTKQRNEWRISKAPSPPSSSSAEYWNVVHKRWAFSFHNTCVPPMIVCIMCSLRCVETQLSFLHTLYALLPWFCIQLDFYAYHTQKFALMQLLYLLPLFGKDDAKIWKRWQLMFLALVKVLLVTLATSATVSPNVFKQSTYDQKLWPGSHQCDWQLIFGNQTFYSRRQYEIYISPNVRLHGFYMAW